MKTIYIEKQKFIEAIYLQESQFKCTNEHATIALLLFQYVNKDEDFELPRKEWYLKMAAEQSKNESFKNHLLKIAEKANNQHFYDLNKGIGLIGSPGVFKTSYFRILQRCFNAIHEDNRIFAFKSFREFIEAYKTDGESVFDLYQNKNLMLDDFGFLNEKEEKVKYFGSDMNPVEYIAAWRYRIFTDHKKRVFHFTTNLKWSDFLTRYDEFAHSRIKEMCNILVLEGENMRNVPRKTPAIPPNKSKETVKETISENVTNLLQAAEQSEGEGAKLFLELVQNLKSKPQKIDTRLMNDEEVAKYHATKFRVTQSTFHAKWEEFANNDDLKESVRIELLAELLDEATEKNSTSDIQKLQQLIEILEQKLTKN